MDLQQIKQAFTGSDEVPEEQSEALQALKAMLKQAMAMVPPLPPAIASLLAGAAVAPRPAAEWATIAPVPDTPEPDQNIKILLRCLPPVLRLMLKRRLSDEVRPLAIYILKRSVKLAVRSLVCSFDDTAELLDTIFNDDARFYAVASTRFYTVFASEDTAELGEPGAYTQPSQYLRVNKDMLQVLEHFGVQGGFHMLLGRIRARVMSVSRLLALIKPFGGVRKLVRTEVLRPWMVSVHAAVTEQLANATEAELRTMDPRKELAEMLEGLEALLRTSTGDPDLASATVERLQLEAAQRCLRSSVMDRRLWAFQAITASLAYSVRLEPDYDATNLRWITTSTSLTSLGTGDRAGLGNAAQSSVTRALYGLECEWLVTWLVEHHVVDEIFGPRMHPELVSRATDLLRFLAHARKLSTAQLDQVWSATVGQQESTAVTIYRLLERSAPAFDAPHIQHLLALAASLDAQRLELPAVGSLVYALSVAAFRIYNEPAADEAALAGLRLLFRLATTQLSSDAALRHLCATLALPGAAPHRAAFAQMCVELLRTRPTPARASVALELLQRLVAAADNTLEAVTALEKEHSVRQVLLDELTAMGTRLSTEQLKARLSFLSLLGTQAATSQATVQVLWQAFVVAPHSHALAAITFDWLASLCPDPSSQTAVAPLVDLPLLASVLARLSALAAKELTPAALACLVRYVRAVNRASEQMATYDTTSRPAPLSLALHGLDPLWAAALLPRDSAVAKSASDYIVQLYVAAEDAPVCSSAAHALSPPAALLEALMSRLESSAEEQALARCLDLLTSYLAARQMRLRTRMVGVVGAGAGAGSDKGEAIMVSLSIAGAPDATTWVQPMQARDTVGDLRDRLAARVGSNLCALVVCERTLEANLDGELLEDMGLDARPVLLHLPPSLPVADAIASLSRFDAAALSPTGLTPAPAAPSISGSSPEASKEPEAVPAPEPEVEAPETLVVQSAHYFDALFRVLRFPSLAPRVWSLVTSSLPLNPRLRGALAQPDATTAWPSLLPPAEPHRLLYALQIVHTLQAASDSAAWAAAFTTHGGRAHLLQVLQAWSPAPSTADTLAALLKALTSLLANKDLPPLSEKDSSSLVHRLLVLVATTGGVAGMALLGQLLASQSALIDSLIASPAPLADFLQHALVTPPSISTATEARRVLHSLAASSAQLATHLRAALLHLVPQVSSTCVTCLPLFELLADLLAFPAPPLPAAVIDELAARLAKLPGVEREDDMSEDLLAQGIMSLMRTALVSADVKVKLALVDVGLMRVLLDALFRPATAQEHGALAPPRFKRDNTRIAALELLGELASAAPAVLLRLLLSEHLNDQRAPHYEWEYAPRAESRAQLGYVGLRNLGCTCYMNSLLQQLFMMPRFRKALLRVDHYAPPEKDKRVEDGLLYQLQTTFAHLHESDKQCYHPGRLVSAVGADPGVQMDVDEFFNTLCDRIDEPLKHTPHAALLKSLWRGSLKSQLLGRGEGCMHASERDEEFYALAVDVKGKATLQEALALYVQGEVLQGDNAYKCESCARPVATLKRTVIGSLPDVLILALKRFEFNFDTMRKQKLNDACTFPDQLNMLAYTKEGLLAAEGKQDEALTLTRPAPYYEYTLAGILVHRGVADSGHYYSFIKERGARADAAPDQPVWLEFNDDVVRAFDPKDIPDECFGGVDTALERSVQGRTATGPLMKTRSAYMLIYERVQPFSVNSTPLPVSPSPAPSPSPSPSPAIPTTATPASAAAPATPVPASVLGPNAARKMEGIDYVESYIIGRQKQPGLGANEAHSVAIPRAMYDEAWFANERFNVDKRIWDPAYFAFVADFVRVQAKSMPLRLLPSDAWLTDNTAARPLFELAVRFFTDVLLHSRDRSSARSFLTVLEGMAEKNVPGCRWAMERCARVDPVLDNWSFLEVSLLLCRTQEARQLMVAYIMAMLKPQRVHEVQYLAAPPRPPRRRRLDDSTGSDERQSDDDESRDEDDDENDDENDDDSDNEARLRPEPDYERAISATLARRLLAFTEYSPLARYWRQFGEYFEFFARMAELGWEERRFLIAMGVVSMFIDVYLHDDSPIRKKKSKIRMGDRYEQPNFYHLVGTLDLLICSCPAREARPPRTTVDDKHVLVLRRGDEELVECTPFWAKLVRDGGRNRAATVRLLQHYQHNAQKHSELLMRIIQEALTEADADRMYWLIVDVTGGVLAIEDDFQESRAVWLIETTVNLLSERRHSATHRRYVLEGVRALRILAKDSALAANELGKIATRTAWMDPWVRMMEEYAT